MINMNITNFRRDIFNTLDNAIKYNEPVNVSTKDGNVVILSEAEYRGLMETLSLSSIPGMKEEIIQGLNAPLSDFVPESEVQW